MKGRDDSDDHAIALTKDADEDSSSSRVSDKIVAYFL